ncbi:MAG: Crp/Fnr family transcriptional regulator [Candidatus Rokubacteria bacterium]|nr:Crp/Fnr family transcriptional regulator [Candidatus Rokubacteria bacterium]
MRRVPYFASLPRTELRRLAGRCTVRALAAGETVFEEGQPCRGLLIVAEGVVEIRQVSLRGREQVFHTEGPGAALGEAPLFDGGGYIASAVALAPTRVLFLPRADVVRLCQRRPAVALAMLKTLARRVRRFADIVSDLAFRPVTERVARHLATAAGEPIEAGTRIDLGVTQSQLAARLGTVRELVARAFSQLEHAGVISRDRARVVVRDPARLGALARGEEVLVSGGSGVT